MTLSELLPAAIAQRRAEKILFLGVFPKISSTHYNVQFNNPDPTGGQKSCPYARRRGNRNV